MKSLTLIVHTGDEQDLINHLRESEGVKGFTLSHAEGHGLEPEQDAFLAARDRVVGASPRLRVEIVLQEDALEAVLDGLRGLKDRGRLQEAYYWAAPVDAEGHL